MKATDVGARRHRIRPWFPVPTWEVVTVFVVGVTFTVLLSQGFRTQEAWDPITWNNFDARWRESGMPLALVGATWGAWLASPAREASVIVGRSAARPIGTRTVRVLAVAMLTIGAAFILGISPLLINTLIWATGGTPTWLALLAGLVQLSVWPALGYLIAVVLRTRLSVFVALAVAIWLTRLGPASSLNGYSWLAIAPFWEDASPLIPFQLTLQVQIARIVFFGLCTVICLVISAAWSRAEHATQRARALAWTAVPLLAAALMVIPQPNLVAAPSTSPVVCSEQQNVRVCVHQHLADRLPLDEQAASSVLHRFVPDDQYLVHDGLGSDPALPTDQIRELASNATHVTPLAAGGNTEADYIASAQYTLAAGLSGLYQCPVETSSFRWDSARSLHEAILVAAVDDPEYPQKYPWPFDQFDREALTDWYRAHAEPAQTCAITPEMLQVSESERPLGNGG